MSPGLLYMTLAAQLMEIFFHGSGQLRCVFMAGITGSGSGWGRFGISDVVVVAEQAVGFFMDVMLESNRHQRLLQDGLITFLNGIKQTDGRRYGHHQKRDGRRVVHIHSPVW